MCPSVVVYVTVSVSVTNVQTSKSSLDNPCSQCRYYLYVIGSEFQISRMNRERNNRSRCICVLLSWPSSVEPGELQLGL